MSHFAEIDKDGIVQRVIVAEQIYIDSGEQGEPSKWIQTSYNNNFRKQYCGPGFTYDKINDVFVQPTPYPSWTLDSNHDWQPPIPLPDKIEGKGHEWDEETTSWLVVDAPK